jgi:hypothetical protein
MTWKWKGLVLLGLIAALAGHCASTVWGVEDGETWIETFDGLDYGAFFDVTLTDDNALLVVGTTVHPLGPTTRGDVLIVKLTLAGEPIWEKTYGGDATDQAFCVEATEDGGFLVLAETDSFGAGERDLYVLKLDASGDLVWSETYGRAGIEWAKDLLAVSDGGFLLIGETDSFGVSFDAYVVKIDENGAVLWETTLGDDDGNEAGVAGLEAENGGLLILAGVSYPGGYEGNRRDARLFRLDSGGSVVWSALYHGDVKQWPNDMVFSPDGDVVIVGIVEPISKSESLFDFWFAKADTGTGELIWSRQEGSQYQDDYGVSVVAIAGGGYLVAGFGPGLPMMRFDDAGNVSWVRNAVSWRSWIIYGGFSILGLPDETFIVPGWVYVHRVGDDFDAVLARIDCEGRIAE